MVSVDEALSIGASHHQAGRLAEAERIYRQVLTVDPDNSGALNCLGMLAAQVRQFELAIELFGRAIGIDRSQAAFHANQGEAYRHLGKTDDAAECFRRALKLQPDLAQVHTMLGGLLHDQRKLDEAAAALREALRLKPEDPRARARLGHVLVDQNKLSEAEACFRRLLRADQRSADAHFNLASVLQAQGRLDEAAESYRAALAIDPQRMDAHNNLGTIRRQQGSIDEALEHYRTALRIKPDYSPAHINLGLVYEQRGQNETAERCYRAALETEPGSTLARTNLGAVLLRQGNVEAALDCFRQVIASDPGFAPAHLNLSYVYQLQGKLKESIASCREAVRLDPSSAEAHNNLGAAWSELGRRDEAIASCRRALELNPDFSLAHSNLAVSLQALGRLDEAIAHHRKAIELAPEGAGQHSNLLYALNYHPACDAESLFAEHRAWGARHADPLTARAAPHANDRSPDRRLRIGYTSAFFRAHAVNFFVEPILASHDHRQFEIFCYSSVAEEDDTTARLRGYADQWRDVVADSDERIAQLVRADAIDILLDLTGHINGGKRMMVFARKPAPIQVTYIGYQNTTGMLAMDYRLTDDYSDPPGLTDRFHTERLVRLPRSFFCYLPSEYAPPVDPLPALANGFVTFGSVNNFTKITAEVLAAWARILLAVPNARLVVRADMTDSLREDLLRTFATYGVEPQRLELVNRLPREKYLELIGRFDIALDPFPFNGHTTTCDCLWQGVPVLTLSGQTYVSRFGGSGLVTLGLEDWIAHSVEDYVRIAAQQAADVAGLARLRAELRPRMAQSPLLDFQGFTRNLEAAYRRMWHAWCAG